MLRSDMEIQDHDVLRQVPVATVEFQSEMELQDRKSLLTISTVDFESDMETLTVSTVDFQSDMEIQYRKSLSQIPAATVENQIDKETQNRKSLSQIPAATVENQSNMGIQLCNDLSQIPASIVQLQSDMEIQDHNALSQIPVATVQLQNDIEIQDHNVLSQIPNTTTVQPQNDMEIQDHNVLRQIPVASVQFQSNKPIPDNTVKANDLATLMKEKLHIYNDEDENNENCGSNVNIINDINVKNETIDWEEERKEMDKLFEQQCKDQLNDLPEFSMPPRFKESVSFRDHQKDGIRWLLQQEQNPLPNPFVRSRELSNGTIALYDRLTRGRLMKAHAPAKGSILADDMGLGKTIQTLALIMSNPPKGKVYGRRQQHLDELCFDSDVAHCTLIVCPKTVISNWLEQAADFITPGTLSIETYTGTFKKRSNVIRQVRRNEVDILLSTYETIACGFEKVQKDSKGNTLLDIFDANFHRIVLDEAQEIRDPKRKRYKAIMAIAANAKYRLALTGTPFVNKPEDIYSLLSFIDLKPLSCFDTFKTFITEPIRERRRAGLTRLRAALAYVALRRTKSCVHGLLMVKKEIKICRIDFPDGCEHKKIYNCLYGAMHASLEGLINGSGREYTESKSGITSFAQQSMFGMLLRLRQACDCTSLLTNGYYHRSSVVLEKIQDEFGNLKPLSAIEGRQMIEIIQNIKNRDGKSDTINDDDEHNQRSSVVLEESRDEFGKPEPLPIIEKKQMLELIENSNISDVELNENNNEDENYQTSSVVLEKSRDESGNPETLSPNEGKQTMETIQNFNDNDENLNENNNDDEQNQKSSVVLEKTREEFGTPKCLSTIEGKELMEKIQNSNNVDEKLNENKNDDERISISVRSPKVCALLNTIGEMAKEEKAIVFSQWTSFLDIIQNALIEEGYQYTRIDGSMNTEQRTKALRDLKHNNDVRLILCSLKACGVGVNLTRANVVFMMDPWWNDATEAQAIDRCHRMGQTRPVRVYRFVMKDTIEERMLQVQRAKQALGKGTMVKLSKKEEKLAKITGLKDLFEIQAIKKNSNCLVDDWY